MKFKYPVDKTNNNLSDIEKREREIFNRKQIERERIFENEQKKRREYYDKEINEFELNYNPYNILSLDKDCSLKELKTMYKKLAIKYHPDRNNGETDKEFKLITQAYLYILKKKEKTNNIDIKINKEVIYKKYNDDINESRENIYLDKDNFNLDKFNQIFNKYKIPNAYDDGYDDIIKSTNISNEKMINNNNNEIFGKDFNIDVFNETFKDIKEKSISNQIIQYEEPIAINSLKNSNFCELGIDKMENFGIKNEGLGYTDYKIAHQQENMLINVDNVKIKSYKSINHLKAERENISYEPSEEDLKLIQLKKQQQNEAENRRLYNIKYNDKLTKEQYNKLNNLLIK
jgi:curved DNA-binding protein CbpA